MPLRDFLDQPQGSASTGSAPSSSGSLSEYLKTGKPRTVTPPTPEPSTAQKFLNLFPKVTLKPANKGLRGYIQGVAQGKEKTISRVPEIISKDVIGGAIGVLGSAAAKLLSPAFYVASRAQGKSHQQAVSEVLDTIKETSDAARGVGESVIPGSVSTVAQSALHLTDVARSGIGHVTGNKNEQKRFGVAGRDIIKQYATTGAGFTGQAAPTDQEIDAIYNDPLGKVLTFGGLAFDAYVVGSTLRPIKQQIKERQFRQQGEVLIQQSKQLAQETLGLTGKFTEAQLKNQYRILARQYHPDVAQNPNPQAFNRITQAYAILSNKGEILKNPAELSKFVTAEGFRPVTTETKPLAIAERAMTTSQGAPPQAIQSALNHSPSGKVLSPDFVSKSIFDAQKQILSGDVQKAVPNVVQRQFLARSLENIPAGQYSNLGQMVDAIAKALPRDTPDPVRALIIRQAVGQAPMFLSDPSMAATAEAQIFTQGPPQMARMPSPVVNPGTPQAVKPAASPISPVIPQTIQPTVASPVVTPTAPQVPGQQITQPRQPLTAPVQPQVQPVQQPVSQPQPLPEPTTPITSATAVENQVTTQKAPGTIEAAPQTTPLRKEFFVYDTAQKRFEPTKGRPVTEIADMDAFLHKNMDGSGEWVVSEGSTGGSIASGATAKEAVANAIRILDQNRDRVGQVLQQALQRNGVSPRYQEAPVEIPEVKLSKSELARIVKEIPDERLQQEAAKQILEQKRTEAEKVARGVQKLEQAITPRTRLSTEEIASIDQVAKGDVKLRQRLITAAEQKPNRVEGVAKAAPKAPQAPQARPAPKEPQVIQERAKSPSKTVKISSKKQALRRFESDEDAKVALEGDLRSVAKRVNAKASELTAAVEKLRSLTPGVAEELNAIIRVRNEVNPKGRVERRLDGYFNPVERQLALGKHDFAATMVHEVSHVGWDLLEQGAADLKEAITAEWNAMTPKEQVAAIGGKKLYNYYKEKQSDMAGEYFARTTERIFQGEKVKMSNSMLRAVRQFFSWLMEKIKGLKPISDNVRAAYDRIFAESSRLRGELSTNKSYRANDTSLQESIKQNIQRVPVEAINIKPSTSMFDPELDAEFAVDSQGFKPGKLSDEIILKRKGDRFDVVSGMGVLRGIQRRVARGAEAPAEIDAVIKEQTAATEFDHRWNHVDPRELKNEGFSKEEISAMDDLTRASEQLAETLETDKGFRQRVIEGLIYGNKVSVPHQEFPEAFIPLYTQGYVPAEANTKVKLQELADIFKKYGIKSEGKETELIKKYRNHALTAEEADQITPKILELNRDLTVWTDSIRNELVKAGKLDPNQRVEDYFPLYLNKDGNLKVNQRMAADAEVTPGFLKKRKNEPYEVDTKVGLVEGLSIYARGVYKEIYLRPAIKESLKIAEDKYEGSQLSRAKRWLEYVRDPFYVEGGPVKKKALSIIRSASTVTTRLGSSGMLGPISVVKNIGFGLQWNYAYGGNHAFRAQKALYGKDGAKWQKLVKQEAPTLVDEALPLIYGTFGSPATQAVKRFGKIQQAFPTTYLTSRAESRLRTIAYLTGRFQGEAMGLTGDELNAHALLHVVKTQQIYSNIDTPEIFRGTGGRIIGQFVMPKFKAVFELMKNIAEGNWKVVARWIAAGIVVGSLLNLLPKRHLITKDGEEYTTGGASFFEPLDILDIRKGYALRKEGTFGIIGGMAEGVVAPLVKIGIHAFGGRLPSDDIYNKYRSKSEILQRDLANFVPETAFTRNFMQLMLINNPQYSKNAEYINSAIGLNAKIEAAENKGDKRAVEKLKKQYEWLVPFIDEAISVDSSLRSLSQNMGGIRKELKESLKDGSMKQSEYDSELKKEEKRYQGERDEIIQEFNKGLQRGLDGEKQLQSFLGIKAAEAKGLSEQQQAFLKQNPQHKVEEPKKVELLGLLPGEVQTGKKLDQVTESIAKLEGWTNKGSSNIRRNNPGNLVYASQEGAQKTPGSRFATFVDQAAGWKALQRQIQLDARRGKTLTEFIHKYAPPAENDTERYISNLSTMLGVSPRTKLADFIDTTL